MCMVTYNWQDESICWLGRSVTPNVFGPIRPIWTGPKQSRPAQSGSGTTGDSSDPHPKISWTGPGLDWPVPVRTEQLLNWWNDCNTVVPITVFGVLLTQLLLKDMASITNAYTAANGREQKLEGGWKQKKGSASEVGIELRMILYIGVHSSPVVQIY